MAGTISRRLWIAMIAAPWLAGCGAPAPTPDAPDAAPLVWPAPPQQPRIRYSASVTGPQD